MSKPDLDTIHHLPFEVANWITPDFLLFQIGTCNGQWRYTGKSYDILSIKNSEPGNGHLNDVFEWFEYSCKRDHKNLVVLELFNEQFKIHLIKKRGFKIKNNKSVLKRWEQMK